MRAHLFFALFLFACGDAASSPADAATDAAPPDVFAPASHLAPPTVVNAGGDVLASPKVVVVTFESDPLAPQIEAFAQAIGKSAYWSATTSEYGVSGLAYTAAVHVADALPTPLTEDAFESWLAGELDGTHAEWPAFDPDTIYSVVLPKDAGVMVDGVPPCESSPAYHYEIPNANGSGKSLVYAAVNRCDPFAGLAGIDYVTAGLSHEWIEAATDPHYVTGPAWEAPAEQYVDWTLTTGGEVADMCTNRSDVYFQPADLAFTVQRSWSNASATAGHDPCVPAEAGAYFGAAPELDATVHGSYDGEPFASEGVHALVGSTVTVPVDLFSDAPTDPFTVSAHAFDQAKLTFTWDRTSGQNGDQLILTIERTGDGPNTKGADFFTIAAQQGTRQSVWMGAIGN